jgi:hypothetical protein
MKFALIFIITALLILAGCTIKSNECSSCPLLSQPSPDWCKYGKIVDSGKNACGCQLPPKCELVACTEEAKICPDGSAVGRVGPDCEFAPCPANLSYREIEKTNQSCVKDDDCLTPEKYSVMSSCPFTSLCISGKCSVICPDYAGRVLPNENETETGKLKNYCAPESRNAQICTLEYRPVCGWFDSSIKCIKYPCAINANNSCLACYNANVEYWTEGKCPE